MKSRFFGAVWWPDGRYLVFGSLILADFQILKEWDIAYLEPMTNEIWHEAKHGTEKQLKTLNGVLALMVRSRGPKMVKKKVIQSTFSFSDRIIHGDICIMYTRLGCYGWRWA